MPPGLFGRTHLISAGFTPAGSPVGWWPADEITGLSDGDPVGTWPDQSGNGYDLAQATAGNKPTYKTNIQNSLASVRFDGTADFMECCDVGTDYSNEYCTVHFVGASAEAGNARCAYFCMMDDTGDSQPYCHIEMHLDQNAGVADDAIFIYFGNGVAYNYDSGIDELDTDAHIWTVQRNGTGVNVSARKDTSTITLAGTDFDDAGNADSFRIGARASNSQFWDGDMFELIYYDSFLSSGDRDTNESGLNSKWAVY